MITVFCQGRTRTYHIYIRRNEKEEFNTIEKVKALLKGIAATNKKRVFAGSEGMGKKMTPGKQFNMDQRIE